MEIAKLPIELTRLGLSTSILMNLIVTYSPIRYYAVNNKFQPCTYEYLLPHFYPVADKKAYNLISKENLTNPDQELEWFRGISPDSPTYIYIYYVGNNEFAIKFHNLFAYNKGKSLLFLRIGNHIVDNSMFTIHFNDKLLPVSVSNSYHGKSETIPWNKTDNWPYQRYQNHCIIYTAFESNETYMLEGVNIYRYLLKWRQFKLFPLVDFTSKGVSKLLSDKYICVTPGNLYGKSNIAFDQNADPVSLNTIYPEIKNYMYNIKYIGHRKMGKLSGKIWRLSGLNKMPAYDIRLMHHYNKISYTWIN